MIVLFALIGVLTGWLLNLVGDYLLRFASEPVQAVRGVQPPALLAILSSQRVSPNGAVRVASELITGVLFAALYLLHDVTAQTLLLMGMCALFVLIAIMDAKYRLVLNVLTYPGILLALIVNLMILHQPVLNIILGVAFAFGLFYITALVRPGGLGGGDVKLAAFIGAIFGFPHVLWALIAAAFVSAVIIAGMLISRRFTLQHSLPYAPFLCLGAIVILIYNSIMMV
ncbi:MAG: A24 family peptidase [Chloroflexota bacterium]|nr:A24 family peptidase [Chloroflexota bacterium]